MKGTSGENVSVKVEEEIGMALFFGSNRRWHEGAHLSGLILEQKASDVSLA